MWYIGIAARASTQFCNTAAGRRQLSRSGRACLSDDLHGPRAARPPPRASGSGARSRPRHAGPRQQRAGGAHAWTIHSARWSHREIAGAGRRRRDLRGQGHLRRRRHGHRSWQSRLAGDPRPRPPCARGADVARRRRAAGRQGGHRGAGVQRGRHQPPWYAERPRRAGSRAARRAARPRRSAAGWSTWRWAAIPAARSASRRATTASSACARATAGSASRA